MEQVGIYFDGCEMDRDCPCCGDRWNRCYDSDVYEQPMIYDETVSEYLNWKYTALNTVVHIYHLNGEHDVLIKRY